VKQKNLCSVIGAHKQASTRGGRERGAGDAFWWGEKKKCQKPTGTWAMNFRPRGVEMLFRKGSLHQKRVGGGDPESRLDNRSAQGKGDERWE